MGFAPGSICPIGLPAAAAAPSPSPGFSVRPVRLIRSVRLVRLVRYPFLYAYRGVFVRVPVRVQLRSAYAAALDKLPPGPAHARREPERDRKAGIGRKTHEAAELRAGQRGGVEPVSIEEAMGLKSPGEGIALDALAKTT